MVLKNIYAVCEDALSRYSSSLEDDREMLQDIQAFPYGSKQRNARIILHGEKKILNFYLSFATRMQKWLRLDRDTLMKRIKQRYADDKDTDEYLYTQKVLLTLIYV